MDNLDIICQLLTNGLLLDKAEKQLQAFSDQEWETLFNLSRKHNVAAILYSSLKTLSPSIEVPDGIYAQMHEIYLMNAARNTLYLHEAEILFDALHAEGIPTIGLKGLYLIENVYENIALRSMSDLDMLLKKEHIPQVLLLIEDLGYRPTTYFNIHDENIDIKHVPPYIKGQGPYLEIHWTLLEENEPFTIGAEGLWQRAIPARMGGMDALALGLEDLILHLCIHQSYQHHLALGLRGLYDIALVLQQKQKKVDWDALVRQAKDWGAERVVALTFHLLEELLDVEIPPDVYPHLLQKPIPREILDQSKMLIKNKVNTMWSVTPDQARFSSESGLWVRVKLVLSRIFLPKITIARLYATKPDSLKIYFYYLVRFYELMRRYFRSTWWILFRDKKVVKGVALTQSVIDLRGWLGGENDNHFLP